MGRQPCCDKVGLKRGPWTIEEDNKLVNFILNNGIHCWRMVPKLAGLLRCGKSCRLRWINYLRPDLKRGGFTEVEEDQIIQLHSLIGNRWSKIASHFPGRTDNEIKNHWNTRIKKRLKLLGIDPLTHKPIEETNQKDDDRNGDDHSDSVIASNSSSTSQVVLQPQYDHHHHQNRLDVGSSSSSCHEGILIEEREDSTLVNSNGMLESSEDSLFLMQNPSSICGDQYDQLSFQVNFHANWVDSVNSIDHLSWDIGFTNYQLDQQDFYFL